MLNNVVVLFEVLKKKTKTKTNKKTESKNPKFVKKKHGRIMLLSKCEVCDSKKSKFIEEQEATGLWSSLEINTPLSKISLERSLFFKSIKQVKTIYNEWNSKQIFISRRQIYDWNTFKTAWIYM